MFEIKGVTVRFADATALRNVSLEAGRGEKVVVRGKSGSGKSTLLRLLLGFVRPDEGEVRVDGETMTPPLAWKLRQNVAYVNQAVDPERGTVEEALTRLCYLKSCPESPDRGTMETALAEFDLAKSALTRQTGDLSGGERQRVALAAAILLKREIFLLDEPTAALDADLKQRVADFFLNRNPSWTVIAVSHDEAWHRPDKARILNLKKEA